MASLDPVLTALADPNRRHVIEVLRHGPCRAGDLAEACGLAAHAMSKHLRILRREGLIEEERHENDQRVRLFRLRRQPFLALQAWLDQVHAAWRYQMSSYAAQVAKRSKTAKSQKKGAKR